MISGLCCNIVMLSQSNQSKVPHWISFQLGFNERFHRPPHEVKVFGDPQSTSLRQISAVSKHVLACVARRRLPSVDRFHRACARLRARASLLRAPERGRYEVNWRRTASCVVDGDEKPSPDAHTVSVHQADAQQSCDGGVHCGASFLQCVTVEKANKSRFSSSCLEKPAQQFNTVGPPICIWQLLRNSFTYCPSPMLSHVLYTVSVQVMEA